MDIELFAKLVTVAGSVFALYKVIAEFVISKKSRLREEFKFIKDFITDRRWCTINKYLYAKKLGRRISA